MVADALSRIVCSMTGTQHSAENSDDFYIESTEAPINVFKHQVILQEGTDKVTISNPFPSYTRVIITPNINDDYLLQVLKNHFDVSKVNGLHNKKFKKFTKTILAQRES